MRQTISRLPAAAALVMAMLSALPAAHTEPQAVTVTDYLNPSYYPSDIPSAVFSVQFGNSKWTLDSQHTVRFGDWSISGSNTGISWAGYHAGDPIYVKIDRLSCRDKKSAPAGDSFKCSLTIIMGPKQKPVCGIFSDPKGDSHVAIECPVSLEMMIGSSSKSTKPKK
jgi:hypothetical protein